MTGHIRIRGARQHNLKNLDLDIPRDTLTVITGLSGSANPRSLSIPSMRKVKGAMWKAFPPMRGNSCN
jgi:excinuclease UvrABC ATPase subunit